MIGSHESSCCGASRAAHVAASGDAVSTQNPGRLELKITSDPANLRHVRISVEEFAVAAGMTLDECNAIGLAVNEALANVIRHGYGGAKDQPILVTAEAATDHPAEVSGNGSADVSPDASGNVSPAKNGSGNNPAHRTTTIEIRVTIRDWAKPFDPKSLPVKNLDSCEITPGGLGLICMRRLMDDVVYEPLSDGMLLRLTKRRRLA
jgi:anti-sigma regulatory factor (Ser/Thr protein kinase)